MSTITKLLLGMFALSLLSCQKFLDEKPNQRLGVPSTVADFQALLDASSRMNVANPAIGEISADNYYLRSADFLSLSAIDRNAYLWEANSYSQTVNDWGITYDVVYYANLALDGIRTIERTAQNAPDWDNVKGCALVFRAKSFLTALWNWSKAYDGASAGTDLGIPLRTTPDFNERSVRASVGDSYQQVISDLKEAVPLLPAVPVHVLRPSRAAAYGFLARTYLSMRDYGKALLYADSSLQLVNRLLDYNTLAPSAAFPFARFNTEVLLHSSMPNTHGNISPTYARLDSVLYSSYSANDLRKTLFYYANSDGSVSFKGSYDNSTVNFNGLTTAELYLVRSECYARSGNVAAALADVNTVLAKRYKTGNFIPQTAANAEDALAKILLERRKELVFRDLRWMDIKRFNKEGRTVDLRRKIDNTFYSLPPNDNRFALALPEDVIALTGMPQNPR